jgi:hypothetical protein
VLRDDLERLLRATTLTTVAFAIALGWSLFQVAEGLGTLITTASGSYDKVSGALFTSGNLGPLTYHWGKHVFTFAPLVQGLVELAVVLAVAFAVRRKFPPATYAARP